jgi:hypothetical protein
MSILGNLLTGGMSGIIGAALGVAKAGIGYLEKRQDARVETYKAQVGVIGDLGGQALRVEAARYRTWSNVAIAAMNHPAWWCAWLLFVIPVGVYDSAIFFVSTFDRWLNSPGCMIPDIGQAIAHGAHVCEYWVRKVPADQRAARAAIIQFIFGAQAATGIVAGVGQAVGNWLGRQKQT